MSHRNRIVLATAALAVALFLTAPLPSHAISHPWMLPAAGAWEQAWSWLLHLLPGGAAPKPGAREKEGSAINPNGGTSSGTTVPLPAGTQSDQGGAANPNGVK
jgi:hypothetical protein